MNCAGMENYWGERVSGRATDREWRRPGLSPSREKLLNKKPKTGRCQYLEEKSGRAWQGNGGAEVNTTEKPPQGWTGTWVQAKGEKGGSEPVHETAAGAGTWRREQGRAAEAGRWRVRVTSRWATLHTRR